MNYWVTTAVSETLQLELKLLGFEELALPCVTVTGPSQDLTAKPGQAEREDIRLEKRCSFYDLPDRFSKVNF